MSESYDGDNVAETSTGVIVVDDDDDDVGINSESTNNQDLSSRETNYDSNNSNEGGVMVSTDNNGSGGDSDGVVVSEDAGREDMFLDAPEDLGADGKESSATFTEDQGSTDSEADSSKHRASFRGLDHEMQNDYMVDEMERLRTLLDKTVNEKESIEREYKDEIEMVAKGIANLRDQMRELVNKQFSLDQRNSGLIDHSHGDVEQAPLHEMILECSMFLRNVTEEIHDLNSKSTEISVFSEVVESYLTSHQNESAEIQFQMSQYIEEVMNRMLSSLSSLVYAGDILDSNLSGKVSHVEKSVYALIENYNWFLYQSDQLRQCLTGFRPDLAEQNDYGVIFSAANDDLLGFKKKETDFVEKLSHLETENYKLMEQLDKHKAVADATSTELERLRAELEQEKHRFSNTKEKLSMAVTKGKALVQQRDSLKQAIVDKTNELEKCHVELKEKLTALEAAELIKEELVKSEAFSASLQELLVQKNLILENLEDILIQSGVPEGLKSRDVMERIRWLVDERNALKDVSLKFHQLADALLSIDLPETFSFSDLESRLGWLTESFDQAKSEIGTLQNELSRTRELLLEATTDIGALQEENGRIKETAFNEMDHVTALLSSILVEKDYLKMELEDMSHKFEATVLREYQVSSEKEQMLRVMLEVSGVSFADKEPPETAVIVEQCLAAIKERTGPSCETSEIYKQILQSLQTFFYVKNQDLALCENLLEEEMWLKKTEVDMLSGDLRKVSEEVAILKVEKETLEKDLERTEDKNALIREKLSMAVKKGKGLVQERDNLKQLIDEKRSEIEKLNTELHQKELVIIECKNENSELSAEVQRIAKLEEDLLALKDQRDQLEKDLLERNNFLQSMIKSINSIVLPANSSLEEPVEKLTWLGGYLSECQLVKTQTEQELEKASAEVEMLSSKISDGHSTIKSLEDALAVAEEKLCRLAEEKRELEIGQTSVQEKLQRAIEEVNLFAETDATRRSLENALALAEIKISSLNREKEEAESSRVTAEAEVDKARVEITGLTVKLSGATSAVKNLEEKVSQLETRISVLTNENNEAQIDRTKMGNELMNLKEEADARDSKLLSAYSTIKSLEEALTKAENGITELANVKKVMEQEISTLSGQLNVSMEGLAGTGGSLENRSLEFVDQLKQLELLGKDESLLTLLRRCCETKFESLKEVDRLFSNIRDQFAEMIPENHLASEEPSRFRKLLATSLDGIVGVDSGSSEADASKSDDISLYVQKIVETYQFAKRTSAEKSDGLFSFLNECNASVVQELRSTSNWLTRVVEKMNSLNQKLRDMERDLQALENRKTLLEDDVSTLLSACSEATEMLQFEVDKRMPEIDSTSEHEAGYEKKFHESKHGKVVEKLLSATSKVCTVCELFEKSRNMFSSRTEELENNLNEEKLAAHKAMEETELYKNKVHELETDIAALRNLCSELRVKVENYQDIEVNLRNKEEEIFSLQDTLMLKEQKTEEALLRASHLENLLDRVNKIQIFWEDSQVVDLDTSDFAHLKKLLYVIDKFPELQHQIKIISHAKEELEIAIIAQLRESEHLKEQVQDSIRTGQELAKVKSMVTDMEADLGRIIRKITDSDITLDQKSVSTNDLVQVLEKLVMVMVLESEKLKSKTQELELQIENSFSNEQELAKLKGQLLDVEAVVQRIIQNLGGDISSDQRSVVTSDQVLVLEKLVMAVIWESENLKSKTHERDLEGGTKISSDQELTLVKGQLSDTEEGLRKIIQKLSGNATGSEKLVATCDLLQVLENMVSNAIIESENSRSEVHEFKSKLVESQKAVDDLSLKVKVLEDSLYPRTTPLETVQERSIFETPSGPSASEISEIEDVGSVSKASISPVSSSAHVRTTWKGSTDHVAVNVDSETSRLIDDKNVVEDKGHVFKSLSASGLVPKQGKIVADRIDGIWVSSDRLLRNRPGARLSFVAYWLLLHIWLLGTIL